MKSEETLSKKRELLLGAIDYTYAEEDVKNSIKKLKEDECLLCDKKLIQQGRGRPNLSKVCDKCRNVLNVYNPREVIKNFHRKIDKIFGKDLI